MTVAEVAAAIRACRFSYPDEDALQRGLAEALAARGFPVSRELRLDARSRLDLLVGRVAVEAKLAGTWKQLLRQADRYLASDRVDGLVVVTSRVRHLRLPATVAGKPVEVVTLAAQGL